MNNGTGNERVLYSQTVRGSALEVTASSDVVSVQVSGMDHVLKSEEVYRRILARIAAENHSVTSTPPALDDTASQEASLQAFLSPPPRRSFYDRGAPVAADYKWVMRFADLKPLVGPEVPLMDSPIERAIVNEVRTIQHPKLTSASSLYRRPALTPTETQKAITHGLNNGHATIPAGTQLIISAAMGAMQAAEEQHAAQNKSGAVSTADLQTAITTGLTDIVPQDQIKGTVGKIMMALADAKRDKSSGPRIDLWSI